MEAHPLYVIPDFLLYVYNDDASKKLHECERT